MFSGGNQTPITPAPSPNDRESHYDKTRISAILGTEAYPRSPKEKEASRRSGEERSVGVASGLQDMARMEVPVDPAGSRQLWGARAPAGVVVEMCD